MKTREAKPAGRRDEDTAGGNQPRAEQAEKATESRRAGARSETNGRRAGHGESGSRSTSQLSGGGTEGWAGIGGRRMAGGNAGQRQKRHQNQEGRGDRRKEGSVSEATVGGGEGERRRKGGGEGSGRRTDEPLRRRPKQLEARRGGQTGTTKHLVATKTWPTRGTRKAKRRA